jgi:hypothetical protein
VARRATSQSEQLAARILKQKFLFKTLRVVLPGLASEQDLRRSRTRPVIAEQLRCQGRSSPDRYRYAVTISIVEGKKRPASDIDNYAKRIVDAITQSQLLWRDDDQIDRMSIRRRREPSRCDTRAVIDARRISGQHLGVPTFFRACCAEASRGNECTYAHPGYHLAIHLWEQQPYDMDADAWAKETERLTKALDQQDNDGVWNWFKEHYPKCMKLVPARRKGQFVAGVRQAYGQEEFDA